MSMAAVKRRCAVCETNEDPACGGFCGTCGGDNWVARPLTRAEQNAVDDAARRREALRRPKPAPREASRATTRPPEPLRAAQPPLQSVETLSVASVSLGPETVARTEPARRPPKQLPLQQSNVDLDEHGFMSGSQADSMIVDDFAGARINELLGGTKRNSVILVVGLGGAGKSTAAADLAARASEHWSSAKARLRRERQRDCPIYWLDNDQTDTALVRELFENSDADDIFEERVKLLPHRLLGWSFDEALKCVPDSARILVVDSLETWGGNSYARQVEIMKKLRLLPVWLMVVINGANKGGGAAGADEIQRAGDATVYAERSDKGVFSLRYGKKRWKPCASWRLRHETPKATLQEVPAVPALPGGPRLRLVPRPVEDATTEGEPRSATTLGSLAGELGLSAPPAPAPPADPEIPTRVLVPPLPPIPSLGEFTPTGPEPNFDDEFLGRAARWTSRQRNAYKVRLHALGCPMSFLEEWTEEVEAVMRGERPPLCDRGPDGPFCGLPALFVAEDENTGARWYACGKEHCVRATTVTPVADAEPIRRSLKR